MEKQTPVLSSLTFILLIPLVYLFCSSPAVANTFIFNPNTHSWKAINSQGKVVRTGRASGGKRYCPDIHRSCKTPSGVFTVWSKGGPGCVSSRYPVGKGGSPMPYCMFFSKYYAIHGSYDVPNYNASHGCIRVTPSDAKWLRYHFIEIGTKVIVRPY
ncbi:enhanced entry protein EnhA [Legionella gratiana]|uniref:Enhanced entry protein EnhA n=1 Tax=Legionella gratiana TaxID=45066 RepID=A0A378JCC0_9GAMM|nr:L,D-transpeptidase [Legionella gratiana]KTD06435.1 enhanced entry protein EnhA [Legionella gratiana]STX45255.1 enhanced entry protein EnhA [Legionella gratiana]